MNFITELRSFAETGIGLHCSSCNQINLYFGSNCSECELKNTLTYDSEKLRFALFALDRFIKYEDTYNSSGAGLFKLLKLTETPIKNILQNNVLGDLKTIIIKNNLAIGNQIGSIKIENGKPKLLLNKDRITPDTIKTFICVTIAIQLILTYPVNGLEIIENPMIEKLYLQKEMSLLQKIKRMFR